MKIYWSMAICILVFLTSCTAKPEPIQYGMDGCSYCSMTIVDRQHASEYVTRKGKVHKFDATECMMNKLREENPDDIALYLVTDYTDPGEWVDATKASYLISEHIPSPMGAYLSAFGNREAAERIQSANPGILLSWEDLQARFKD
jgi:copper chaperone NosL